MTCEWTFYELEGAPLERSLYQLVDRCLKQGWRCAIVDPDEDRRFALDDALWTQVADGFLPHSLGSAADISDEPVLLVAGLQEAVNTPAALFLLGGVECQPDTSVQRVFVMISAGDEQARQAARQQFAAARKGDGARYFKFEDGQWAQKA